MKNSITLFGLIFGLLLTSASVQAQTAANDFIGTWEYTSQDAPYPYQQGQMTVTIEDEDISVTVVSSNEDEIEAKNAKVKNHQLQFEVFIQGQDVAVKLKMEKENKLSGFADTADGKIALSGIKK